jgi:hypothetical protein
VLLIKGIFFLSLFEKPEKDLNPVQWGKGGSRNRGD